MSEIFELSPEEKERGNLQRELQKHVEVEAKRFIWGEIDEKEVLKRLNFYRKRWLKEGLGP